MGSLSKAQNLILGLLLGMAIAIAIPYAQPSELGASEEVTAVEGDSYMGTTQWWRSDIEEDWTTGDPNGMRGPSSMPMGGTRDIPPWFLPLVIMAFIAFRVWMTRRPEKETWTPSKELEDLVRRRRKR